MSGVRVRERALTVLTRHRKLALANVTISAITFRLGVRDDSDLWVMTRTGRRTVEDRHTDWGGGDLEPVQVTDPARRRN